MTTFRLLHGDCREVLRSLPQASVDACVTDPPYGIGFMGREWDTFKPGVGKHRRLMHPREREAQRIVSDNPNLHGRHRSPALSPSQIEYDYTVAGLRRFQDWTAEWAVEVFRVLKPGAYIVVCGAPRSYHRMASGLEDAGFVVRDQFAWLFGSGYPKSRDLGDGKGTGLKPAHEPIALAWKPFKGSLTACHHQHGTAALNIDACRVAVSDESYARNASGDRGHADNRQRQSEFAMTAGRASDLGRWPANVVIDDVAAATLDEQSGELVSGANPTRRGSDKFRDIYGEFKGQDACDAARGVDVGGASRFYYCAKPSREERDAGVSHNGHPTVKPVELMRWLVRLVTPVGGTVIDPFTGSGTTGVACAHEGRPFIGCERESDYIALASARIKHVAPLFVEEAAS